MPAVRTDKMIVKEEKDKEKQKTTRQSFSCAECRRLKLKCSRTWPCVSCEKRGCAQVCPTGTIKTGKGKRQILANTEDHTSTTSPMAIQTRSKARKPTVQAKKKLTKELHERITALELALAKSHAAQSSQPHPLLSAAYVFSPRDAVRLLPKEARDELEAAERRDRSGDGDREDSDTPRLIEEEEDADMLGEADDDVVDSAFGTLTLGKGGHARYMGSFAGSEYLRDEPRGDGVENEDEGIAAAARRRRSMGPATGAHGGTGILMTPPGGDAPLPMGSLPLMMAGIQVRPGVDVEVLRRQLPDWDTEGQHLVKNYWLNVNWMYMPIPRPLFETDFLLHVYRYEEPVDAHKLACVFLVMALGVMFDLTGPPFRPRREELFALGQACLGAVGLERASLATVRALHLCGTYILNDDHGSGGEIFWPIVGMLIKVATGLGLHRDGSAFGLSDEETEDRRLLWWECVLYDRLRAMCFARPVTMLNKYTDTKTPVSLGQQNDPCQFHETKLKLAVLMEKVIDVQTRVAPVPYSLVTQIDAEFKQFREDMPEPLAPGVQINHLPLDPSVPPHQVIHRLGIRLLVAQSRLLLSRAFFRRALDENPSDPEYCKHGSSFVALYESAQEIVSIVKQLVMYHPSLIARWWFYWFHAYSSAVCLAATTILAPMSPYATPAFEGLCTMYDIAKAAQDGCRAKKGLAALFRLKCRAEDVLRRNNRMGDISSSRRPPANAQFRPHATKLTMDSDDEAEAEDDLKHLDGSGKLRRIKESNTRKSPPTALGLARQVRTAGGQGQAQTAKETGRQQYGSRAVGGYEQLPGRLPTPPMTGTAGNFAQAQSHSHSHHRHGHQNSLDLTSPLSDRSAATSATLNEPWEGIVPPPPPMMFMDDTSPQMQNSRPGLSHHYSAPAISVNTNGNHGNGMMYPPATPLNTASASLHQQQAYMLGNGQGMSFGGRHDTSNGEQRNGMTMSNINSTPSVSAGSFEPQISPALSTATWNSSFNMHSISNAGASNGTNAGSGSLGGADNFDVQSQHSQSHTGYTPQHLDFQALANAQAQGQGQSGQSVSAHSMHSSMISPAFSSHSQSLPSGTPLLTNNSLSFGTSAGSSSGMTGLGSQTYAPSSDLSFSHGTDQGLMLGGTGMDMGMGTGWDFGMGDADLNRALGLESIDENNAFQSAMGLGMGMGIAGDDGQGMGTFNWNDLFGQSM